MHTLTLHVLSVRVRFRVLGLGGLGDRVIGLEVGLSVVKRSGYLVTCVGRIKNYRTQYLDASLL